VTAITFSLYGVGADSTKHRRAAVQCGLPL
jgi:hypothetical protein